MTPEALIAQLRDIHLPPDAGGGWLDDFALWPFMVLGAAVLALIAVRAWRYLGHRHAARTKLNNILRTADPRQQWPLLLSFASQLADNSKRRTPLPNIAYHRPESVTDAERQAFVEYLRNEIKRLRPPSKPPGSKEYLGSKE